MNSFYRFLFSIILLLQVIQLSAQQFYPVQVRPVIRTASVFVADYEDPSNFMVQVKLNDINLPFYRVRLKISIKKDNQEITSKNGILVDLAGGQTYILSGDQLKELLDPSNLNFKDIAFETGKARTLAPGAYHISFEAFDPATNLKVSNSATDFVRALIESYDPPLLNLPFNNNQVEIMPGGQNIMFSWTPRNSVTPPSSQIKYRLRIVKVEPVDRNPYEVMNTGVFLIGNAPYDNLTFTSFIYDRSFLALEEGAVYAWQVQAYELINENGIERETSQRFKNNGFTEVYSFSIKENCTEIILEKPVTDTVSPGAPLIVLNWNTDNSHTSYEIKYRLAGTVLPWTVDVLSRSGSNLENVLKLGSTDLEKGKKYEYTVAAKCKNWQKPLYGGTFQLEMPDCSAPEPIYITSNDADGIKLKWDAVNNATSYNITYQHSAGTSPVNVNNLITPEYTLPHAATGSYTIKVDGVCGTTLADGQTQTVNYNDENIVGNCPLPEPFRILLKSPADPTDKKSASAIWSSLPVHQSYELKYNHRDSTKVWQFTSAVPELAKIPVVPGQLYQYELKYTCKGGKTVTAPKGWFRFDALDDTTVITAKGTADCFPPAYVNAEGKNNTTGRFEWDKVKGSDEYQLYYAPVGTNDYKIFASTATDARVTDLIENGKYNFKVRCRCGGEYSIFSKVGLLDLGLTPDGTCDSLAWFKVLKTTPTEVQLAWKYNTVNTGYTLVYKENSQSWKDQYTENLGNIDTLKARFLTGDSLKYTIINLSPSTVYNFKIQGHCGLKLAVANTPANGETKTDKTDEKDCTNPAACDRTITDPKTNLKVGDTVQVADYKMIISTIESAGTNLWKGTAVAEAPFIGLSENIRFNTTFDKLSVNKNSCVLNGEIKVDSVTAYVLDQATRDKIKAGMDQVDKLVNQAHDLASQANGYLDQASDYGHQGLDYFQGGGSQGKVKTGGLGENIISDKSLTTSKLSVSGGKVVVDGVASDKDAPALVKDKDGKVFSVRTDGNAILVGIYDTTYARMDTVGVKSSTYVVDFKAYKNAKYAFDKYIEKYGEREAMAPHYLKRGTQYFSAKAIVPAVVDYVDFSVSGSDYDEDDITFVNRQGFVFEKDDNTITLAGGPAKDAQEVFAVVTEDGKKKVIGALLLASYEAKSKKVIIVPVQLPNGLQKDVADIAEELNKIYSPAGITYTVEVDETFKTNADWCSTPNCKFKPGGSATLSNNYTGDEKAVVEAYIKFKGEDNLDKEAAYIFGIAEAVVNSGEEELQGKMNFAEQFGFLYNIPKVNEEKLARTLAHELGHGNYKLYHIYTNMYLGQDEKGKTDNVMDYGIEDGDLSLNKVQWDVVNEPGVNWGIFNTDSDQELSQTYAREWLYSFLTAIRTNNMKGATSTLLTPFAGGGEGYLDKILLVEDFVYGGTKYPHVIINVPASNQKTSSVVTTGSASNPAFRGFDNFIKIGDFQITCLADPTVIGGCSFTGTSFRKSMIGWNGQTTDACVKSDNSRITRLKEYLTKKEDNLLLFVNGYRNNSTSLTSDYDNSDNTVKTYDYYPNSGSYWEGQKTKRIDELFVDAIETKNVAYADGHHHITTSNHFVDNGDGIADEKDIYGSKLHFMNCLYKSSCAAGNKALLGLYLAAGLITENWTVISAGCDCASAYHNANYVELDTKPNLAGYNVRYQAGKRGAQDLWRKIQDGTIPVKKDNSGKITGKIDIVAHSMGYVYAQGMIDELKTHLAPGTIFGRFYILAPENPGSATTFDKNLFEEVWQYGSDEREITSKPWELDGIAPQCAVPGLQWNVSGGSKYGRRPIPPTDSNRNFLGAHYGSSFEWIFKLSVTDNGYVKKR